MRCLLLCLFLLPLPLWAQHGAHANKGGATIHGMVLFGKANVYASHLPLFRQPHLYQAVLELQLPRFVHKLYLRAQAANPDTTLFTLVPEPFALLDKYKTGQQFYAVLHQGHFERGGQKISDTFLVKVKSVLLLRQLNPYDSDTLRSYYLIGTRAEAFLVHHIDRQPSYDHIVAVTPPAEFFKKNPALKQVCTRFGVPGPRQAPLEAGKPLTVTLPPAFTALPLAPLRTLYIEYEDLK